MVKLNQVYGIETPLQNAYPLPIQANRRPTVNDKNAAKGQMWIDTSTGAVYILSGVIAGDAIWTQIGVGSNDTGTATLVEGVVSVSDTTINAFDLLFVTRIVVGGGGTTALGNLVAVTQPDTGFAVDSFQDAAPQSIETGDNSSFDFHIIRKVN